MLELVLIAWWGSEAQLLPQDLGRLLLSSHTLSWRRATREAVAN